MASRRAAPFLVVVLAVLLPHAALASAPQVEVAHLSGEINAITASYLDSAVQQAESDRDAAMVVVTDTPGGLSNSMDDISQHVLNSSVPVVVFVSPPGARDDSAGLFISQSADVLAM